MIEIVHDYNIQTKEHNGDFMDNIIIQNRFEHNLSSINIAPEIGILETKIILEHVNNNIIFNKIYDICYRSNKWKKWVDNTFQPELNKKKLIELCGHYIFSDNEFINIKYSINDKIDEIIKTKIYNFLFNKYKLLNKI